MHRLILGLALILGFAATANAQDYPSKPLRLMIPTAPGGMADILGRTLGQKLTEKTGQPVVVENRTGAGGILAADFVAKAPPDGYTLYIGFHATNAILPTLDPKLPYDAAKDFAPVILIASLPNVLVVNPKVEAKTVAELVALTKAKPKTFSFASQGPGSSGHIAGEQFRLLTGSDIVHVPYRGAAPALQDLVAGQVSMMFDIVPFALEHIRAGNVRGLAVATPQRLAVLPELPTMREAGFPEVQGGAWFALFAPAKTPAPIVAWLNAEAKTAFNAQDVRQRLDPRGVVFELGTPEALGAHVAADTERWAKVIRSAGIKLE
jgi:tripartite-type tricarboxylate transporter receptor subunit TctC